MNPRISWPTAAPTIPAISVRAASRGKSRAGNHCAASVNAHTTVGAAPRPIRMRVASAKLAVWDIANRKDATVQIAAPVMSTARAPKRATMIPAGICNRM